MTARAPPLDLVGESLKDALLCGSCGGVYAVASVRTGRTAKRRTCVGEAPDPPITRGGDLVKGADRRFDRRPHRSDGTKARGDRWYGPWFGQKIGIVQSRSQLMEAGSGRGRLAVYRR